ncbi:CBD9-like protein [Mycena chlorophos]|uniref:CBD9-like protein n=1 Tax=Mycena chlorophos TaxID=658473 RepID=A0A8H6SXI7_MYCCL|nr:CBD9-like protein [Mycena chlorophos]
MVRRFMHAAVLSTLAAVGAASALSLTDIHARATGASFCSKYMCVEAALNGSTVEYTLSGTGKSTPGWMGVGFGTFMANSPMVIIPRRESMPTVDSNPPRVATLSTALSTASGNANFVFTVDSNSLSTQPIIYAFGSVNPGSSAVDATLQQHSDYGITQLNLQGSLAGSSASSASGSTPTGSSGSSSGSNTNENTGGATSDIPLTPYQRMIIAHAVFCVVGFALFLPIGALVARFLRTFSSSWYTAHWIAQFVLAGASILAGIVLGFKAASYEGSTSYRILDTHKARLPSTRSFKTGIILFALYIAQCILGAIIHWVKPKRVLRRPPQNYLHALLGLSIIALSLYQIRTGYKTEWLFTGLGPLPSSVNTVWILWCVVLPVFYAAGLVFLRKQYAQEAAARTGWTDEYAMNKGPERPEYHDN